MYFPGRSTQSFAEDNASISETSQVDYVANNRYIGHSPRSRRGYDAINHTAVEGANQNGEGTLGLATSRVVQEPGPIGEDLEERKDNNGLQRRNGVSVAWTPPSFRTYRKYCIFEFTSYSH